MIALRPLGLAVTLVTFLVYELVRPQHPIAELVVVTAGFLAVTPLVVWLGSRFGLVNACRASLLLDTALIATAMSFFSRPEPGAIGFVWTIFIGGFLLAPADTLLLTGLAVAASCAVPPLSVPDTRWVNVVSNMLALSLVGLLTVLLGRQARIYERRMEDVARLREELVSRVSHELRTPLTSIVGFLATLRRADLELEENDRRRFLEIAEQEAQRLGRLVDDVLSVSRARARPLALTRFRVADCCREAAALVSVGSAWTVELELDEAVEIVADRDRVMQILVNLLGNSRRHGHGQTVLRCSSGNDGAVVSISDEGPGVDPELLPTLFEPFASGGAEGDTGLGLAVAKSLAEAHGGSLVYRPPSADAPHAFVLTLPAREYPSAGAGSSAGRAGDF